MKLIITVFSMTIFATSLLAASYEVPVGDGLKEFATFPLENFEKRIEGENIKVSYDLPAILTGTQEHITLEGKVVADGQDVVLFGDKGVAICKGAIYSESVCSVEYFNLKFDEESAIDSINSISKSGVESLARIEVMRAFSTDPVGIIKY